MSLSGGLVPLGGGSKPSASRSQFSYGFESDDDDDNAADDASVPFGLRAGGQDATKSGHQDLGSDSEDDWDADMDEVNDIKAKLDDSDVQELYEPTFSMRETSKQRSAANMAALDELFMDDFGDAAPNFSPSPQEASPLQAPQSFGRYAAKKDDNDDDDDEVDYDDDDDFGPATDSENEGDDDFSRSLRTERQHDSKSSLRREHQEAYTNGSQPRPSTRENLKGSSYTFGQKKLHGMSDDDDDGDDHIDDNMDDNIDNDMDDIRGQFQGRTAQSSQDSKTNQASLAKGASERTANSKSKELLGTKTVNAAGSPSIDGNHIAKEEDEEEHKDELEDSWGLDALDDLMPEDTDEAAAAVKGKSPSPVKKANSPMMSSRKNIVAKDPEPKSEEGYAFTFGRKERRSLPTASTQRKPALENARRDRTEPEKKPTSSAAPSAMRKTHMVTFSDSSDDEDLAISRGPRRPRPWKGLAAVSSTDAEQVTTSTARKAAEKDEIEKLDAQEEKSSSPVPPTPPMQNSLSEHAGKQNNVEQNPNQSPRAQTQAQAAESPHAGNTASSMAISAPVVDVSALVGEIRKELGAIHAERVKELQSKIEELSASLTAERELRTAEELKAKARICELEAFSVREQQARERAESSLASTKADHEASMLAISRAHEESLAELRKSASSAAQINELAGAVGKATEDLRAVELVVAQRHDESERARAAQLGCRERLVEEVETKAREQLERASDEARKLQALYGAMQETNQLVRRQCEEDRTRLGAEHARLEALQLTLKVESETLRNDAMDARARLREERAVWETERQEWRNESHRKETALEAERHALEVARRAFQSERSSSLREVEAALARVREEERLLRESREAQAKTRVSLEEQKAALAREREAIDLEREKNERESQRLRDEADATQRALEDLREAQKGRDETKQLCARMEHSRSEMSREAAQLEKRKRELIEEQCRQQQLRLRVTEERSQVYKKQAEAMREASAARALRRSLTVNAALHYGSSSSENTYTANFL
ncbi:Hypothetical Protein FCC1311_065662 [Hondaea fermentalgiana]|uniref:Uncharacterized protein n=1 Tax=Hondaea fermentalgiana TaxID=2315210 RepID=A0A2R5GHH5_9STRA|nr:Hypothetical Protein FCC1311_065662 [Hondaea fermentalgiana]|eukprot:GBG30347.1 Hypothetical Protein FCC1311_065662 [Hondaea fermentalgiana]